MPRPSRRAEVKQTAARIFREHGYLYATMDQIADAVGLNKGTLYHYYPSKSALLNELLLEQIEATLHMLAQVPLTGSGADRMRSFVRAQVSHVANKRDELVVFFQEMHWIDDHLPAKEARAIRQGTYRYEEFVKSLLAEGTRTGEFRDLDPSSVLYSIIGVLAYLPVWYRTPPSGTDDRVVSEITDFIMNGILAPTALTVSSNSTTPQRKRSKSASSGSDGASTTTAKPGARSQEVRGTRKKRAVASSDVS